MHHSGLHIFGILSNSNNEKIYDTTTGSSLDSKLQELSNRWSAPSHGLIKVEMVIKEESG